MMKLIIVGRRAPGRTRAGAQAHLRDVHARMVVCPPPGSGAMPLDYVQNHVLDGVYPAEGAHAIERDLVTELWFESVDHLRAATGTPYYLENLRPDEPRFVDDASVARLMVRSELLRDGERGRFKTFLFLAAADYARLSAADPVGDGAVEHNAVLSPPDGSAPFVDVVLAQWFADPDSARSALERFSAQKLSSACNFAVAAEEYDTARLRAQFDRAGNS